MRRLWIVSLLVLTLTAAPAFAKGGGKGKGNAQGGQGNQHADYDRDEHRGGHGQNDSSHPPGWDKGKKTGWGNCDVPPGQAKKEGCGGVYRSRRHSSAPRTEAARSTIPVRTPPAGRDTRGSRTTTTTTTRRPATSPMPTTPTTSKTAPKRATTDREPVNDRVERVKK